MTEPKPFAVIAALLAALGCGLMGGVFFAFSTFVMAGLARLPAIDSLHAMQSINQMAGRTLFGALFVVTPLACIASIVAGWGLRHEAVGKFILAGGATYLLFGLLLTIALNIPLNNQLDAVPAVGADYPTE
ncbi:MAG: integral rane protein, partial [Phycisphaerales bacterium]|nr:integral rane protein [Phycisphaerales bacterium]